MSRPAMPPRDRSAIWSLSEPDMSAPTRPPPGVSASASLLSRAPNPWASTTHATSTFVPARRHADTLNAISYTRSAYVGRPRPHSRLVILITRTIRPFWTQNDRVVMAADRPDIVWEVRSSAHRAHL